ncbi:MAG: clostripain-related cysteine peptidase [Candidatus Wallbacteria bacterium]|nr:clostripain-related cysteine peptidase [Candidatus Wallbacteria bacterium]
MNYQIILKAFLLLLLLVSNLAFSNAIEPSRPKEWSIFIYMAVEQDLQKGALDDLSELKSLGSNQSVNFVVQVGNCRNTALSDRTGENSESDIFNGSRRYYIEKDKMILLQNLGNSSNPAAPEVLSNFLAWGLKNYPARRNMLIIWSHGDGILGVNFKPLKSSARQITETVETLTVPELRKVLEKTGGFDVVGFDACLMSNIETAYELSHVTRYMFASEENIPGPGLPYSKIFDILESKPAIRTEDLLARLTEQFVNFYQSDSQFQVLANDVTMAAVDCAKIEPLIRDLDAFSLTLLKSEPDFKRFISAQDEVQKFNLMDFVDLSDLLARCPDRSGKMREELLNCVISENHSGDRVKNAHGLSIYVSLMVPDLAYEQTMFGRDTHWLAVLLEKSNFDSYYRNLLSQLKKTAQEYLPLSSHTREAREILDKFNKNEEEVFSMITSWIVRMQSYAKLNIYLLFLDSLNQQERNLFQPLSRRLCRTLNNLDSDNASNSDFNKLLLRTRMSELEKFL